MLSDLRYALRQLLRAPAFTAASVLTLALGIGANSALFTLANALLFRARPGVRDAERLVWIAPIDPHRGKPGSMSYPDLRAYQGLTDAFAGVAGIHDAWVSVRGGGDAEPVRVRGEFASASFFDVLRTPMALGRGFAAAEDSAGAPPVAVLAHHVWSERFGADPSVLGRRIVVNGHDVTVVGVAPAGFNGADHEERMRALWLPLAQVPALMPGAATILADERARLLRAVGRLRGGTSQRHAAMAVATLTRQRWAADSTLHTSRDARLYSAAAGVPPGGEEGILPLAALSIGVTGIVLLIACANVSNLLLARAVARRRELAVRLALGAGRSRLVRQLLTESLLLGALGSAVALIVALWGTELLAAKVLPLPLDVSPDGRLLVFSAVVAVAAAALFGLVPALHATRADINATLKDGAGGATARRSRLQSTLVGAQIALSFLLLVTGGLFLRGLQRANAAEVGFDASSRVLAMSFDLHQQGYGRERQATFVRELLERASSLPGVEAAVTTGTVPMGSTRIYADVAPVPEAGAPAAERRGALAMQFVVSPGFFRAIRLPLARGRDFSAEDDAGAAPVAIVSEAMAARMWPGENAIGKRVSVQGGREPQRLTVIGVARESMLAGVSDAPPPQIYVPRAQRPEVLDVTLLVRTTAPDASTLSAALRRELRRMNPDLPVYDVRTLAQYRHEHTAEQRSASLLLGILGAVALLLASVGVYGVIAFAVGQRTREVGVRMALGARPGQVVWMFLREGGRRILPGLVAGVLMAAGIAKLLSSAVFFGVEPMDAVAFIAVASLLGGVAMIASWLPARRAARVSPTVALRSE